MEQLNAKKDSWLAWLLFVSMILALSMSLTACGGKKSSGKIAASPPATDDTIDPSCTDCGSYKYEIASGLNMSHVSLVGDIDMALVVYGSTNVAPYNGQVVVKGTMTISNPKNYMACNIPAGNYTVVTKQAGGTFTSDASGYPFNLSNVQAEIVNKADSSKKYQMTISYLEFEEKTPKHPAFHGVQYDLSFYGQTYLCGNTSIFYPIE